MAQGRLPISIEYATNKDIMFSRGELETATVQYLASLPWRPDPETYLLRETLYSCVLDCRPSCCSTISVPDASLLSSECMSDGSYHDPLKNLRIHQPHLSEEIEDFIISHSNFYIGSRDKPEDGLKAAAIWVQRMGHRRMMALRDVIIPTSEDKLSHHPSDFLVFIQKLAVSLLGTFSLTTKFKVKVQGRTPESEITQAAIHGFGKLTIRLEFIEKHLRAEQVENIVRRILSEMLAQAFIDDSYGSSSVLQHSTSKPSSATTQSSFQKLPAEVRSKIYDYLSHTMFDCSKWHQHYNRKSWSYQLGCPRTLLVDRQFVREFSHHFLTRLPHTFRLDKRLNAIHDFLTLIGGDRLSKLSRLRIIHKSNHAWTPGLELPWLVNILNHFSIDPECGRTVTANDFIGSHKRYKAYHKSRLPPHVQNAAGPVYRVYANAQFRITLSNKSIQVNLPDSAIAESSRSLCTSIKSPFFHALSRILH